MTTMTSPQTPIRHNADLNATRLDRLDAEIAALQQKLAAKVQDRSDLAARWGYATGLLVKASPEMMRRTLKRGMGQ